MTDWLGETTFEVDLLHQLKSATDHKGKTVTYDYDAVGNQTAIHYPDDTTATYDYDLVKNQTKVTETDGSETTYTYDGMGRVTEMHYPNGWVEYYTYDKMGRILAVNDTHPSEKPAKTQKHTYQYDANGNMTYEYMRGNGTGQAKNETLYTYDALNRLVTAHDNYGNSTRTYTYDSLGNLTFETGLGSHNMDYRYNNLNQIVDQSDDGWKTHTASTYDNRGNLVLEQYGKNKKLTTAGSYTFDETNKMVEGVNGNGEKSQYSYNGLGALMQQTWIIAKNGYGYHNVDADETSTNALADESPAGTSAGTSADALSTEDGVLTNAITLYGNAGNGNNGNNGNGNGNKDKPTGSQVKKTSTVVKQFVVDFTSDTYKPLMEHEVNGLDYRYVYSDKARLSVVVQGIENGSASVLDANGELHAYYHCDYLGTTDYLTSAVNSKIISWTNYNEWGEITHNAVLKCGQRELDLVKEYATHDYDAVLNMYYAKARMYDADNRHFTAQDPILDPSGYNLRAYTMTPVFYDQYLYVANNAIVRIDILGEKYTLAEGSIAHAVISAYIEFEYPKTMSDAYVYGVKENKSNRGRPDIVIPFDKIYHVYEIKSDQYISFGRYKDSAYDQLGKYIRALHSGNSKNSTYALAGTAIRGTVLNWNPHKILPYIADPNKVVEAWTNSTPGMIYYKIREKKKTDKVESEEFVTAEVRAHIGYYAMVACEYPPESAKNLVNVDSYSDLELNNSILDWLDEVVVSQPGGYHQVTFSDGTIRYHALSPMEQNTVRSDDYTPKELLNIYEGANGWSKTIPGTNSWNPNIPFVPVNPTIPVMPPVSIPAPLPIPVLV